MNLKEIAKTEWIILFPILLPFVLFLAMGDSLPAEIPVHYSGGVADRMGSPYEIAFVGMGIYLLMLVIPFIDPKRENYQAFKGSYRKIRIALSIFLSAISIVMVYFASETMSEFSSQFILIAALGLMALLGNYMSTFKPNWFVGIRTPWTLSNDEVWRTTHKFAGRLWFWACLAYIGMVLVFHQFSTTYFVGFVLILALIPCVYSYFEFKRLEV